MLIWPKNYIFICIYFLYGTPGHHSEKSPHHEKETHGTSDDIDENTPIDEVKGPSVFERVKEEVEAVVEAIIHPHKDSNSHDSSSKWEVGWLSLSCSCMHGWLLLLNDKLTVYFSAFLWLLCLLNSSYLLKMGNDCCNMEEPF